MDVTVVAAETAPATTEEVAVERREPMEILADLKARIESGKDDQETVAAAKLLPSDLVTSQLIESAVERCPNTAAALVTVAPQGTVERAKAVFTRAIERGTFALAEAVLRKARDDDESMAPEAMATPNRTHFELAVDHGAIGVVSAFAERKSFDALARVPDGRTLMEHALDGLDPSAREELAVAMAANVSPLAVLSNGRTVLEKFLTLRTGNAALALVTHGRLLGTERLDDGTTTFEAVLDASAKKPDLRKVCLAMVASGQVGPHGTCSTGVGFYERAIAAGDLDVAARLAASPSFEPLERTGNGRTLFELALDSGAKAAAMAVLSSGRLPARALLSDGRTAFERALKMKAKDLVLGAFAGQGMTPTTLLPPDDKTAWEIALLNGGADLALVMARFAGLDGLMVLGDGKTCFERAVLSGHQEVAVAMIEAGTIKPSSRLPDSRTCLEFAASSGARDVCSALASRV